MKKNIFLLVLLLNTVAVYAQQNMILIIADDVSPDYFGFYDDALDTANAPHIRALAESGIRFTQAWANPVCSPTRSSMITGRYPFRTGVGNVITTNTSAQLDTSEMTIAKLLRTYAPVKYNTACVGKWHMTAPIIQKYNFPNRLGFNLYSGNLSGQVNNYYYYQRIKNGVADTVTTYATTQTVNDAISWLDTMSANKPFFLWLSFNAPHSPYHKPPNSLLTTAASIGLSGTTSDISANPKKYFKAAIEAEDTEIGRLLQYLVTHNLMDSTNIIFIGDNGNDVNTAQIANTSKAKGTLYDYGVHVPYIIKGPAVVNPGRVNDALVSTTDLFSTIAELCGFSNWINSIPASKLPVDSRSLLSIIKNQNTAVRDWNFTEEFGSPTNAKYGKSIRNNNYHLIRFDNGNEELYKMSDDSLELTNLLAGSPTATDMSNYYSLCDTLSTLIGSTHYCSKPTCTASVSISASNTNICSGASVTFTPTPINGGNLPSYNWYLNGTLVSNANSYIYTSPTNGAIVKCEMISNDNCALYFKAVSNSIIITVNQNPTPIINASTNTVCPGTAAALSTASSYSNYIWSTGATTATISVSQPASYSVTVTDNNGCNGNASTIISGTSTCGAPTGMNETLLKATSVTLNWSAVSCAYKYQVQYRVNGTTTWITKSITAPTVKKALTGLVASTTYQWRIRSWCDAGGVYKSSYTANRTFVTAAAIANNNSKLDLSKDELLVYPNPSDQSFTIKLGELQSGDLIVFDAVGNRVEEYKNVSGDFEFGRKLPKGTYMIQIISNGLVGNKQLVKL